MFFGKQRYKIYFTLLVFNWYDIYTFNIFNVLKPEKVGVRLILFNATFNNISVISWQSVLILVEEIGVPEENHRTVASQSLTSSHKVGWATHLTIRGIQTNIIYISSLLNSSIKITKIKNENLNLVHTMLHFKTYLSHIYSSLKQFLEQIKIRSKT